jgi:hypothetical protein
MSDLSSAQLERARNEVAQAWATALEANLPEQESELVNWIDSTIIGLNRSSEGQEKLYAVHTSISRLSVFSGFCGEISPIANRIVGNRLPFAVIGSGFLWGLPDDTRLAYDYHQEPSHMRGALDIMNVHFPFLGGSTTNNGTMSVLSGSHQQGHFETTTTREADNSYTSLVSINIEELVPRHQEVHLELRLGDVTFFQKDLVHRSNPNTSGRLRPPVALRLTQDFSYGFEVLSPDDL